MSGNSSEPVAQPGKSLFVGLAIFLLCVLVFNAVVAILSPRPLWEGAVVQALYAYLIAFWAAAIVGITLSWKYKLLT